MPEPTHTVSRFFRREYTYSRYASRTGNGKPPSLDQPIVLARILPVGSHRTAYDTRLPCLEAHREQVCEIVRLPIRRFAVARPAVRNDGTGGGSVR